MKTNNNEEDFIVRIELEKRRKAEEEHQNRLAEADKNTLRELHYMRCPKCGMELSEIDYQSIKIDKCFNCSGIWLDAGELGSISKLEQSMIAKVLDIFR